MTQDEFKEGFNRLVEAFNIFNAERKAKIYFEELSALSPVVFLESVRRIIRQNDRFPTISTILGLVDIIQPTDQDRSIRVKCERCDGYGWASFLGHAFRSRCIHSQKLSEKIAFVPETLMDQTNWARKIEKEQNELYGQN